MRRCENCGGTGKDGWIKGQAQERDCKLCKGSGVDPRECPTCNGNGIVHISKQELMRMSDLYCCTEDAPLPSAGTNPYKPCKKCRGTGTLTNPK